MGLLFGPALFCAAAGGTDFQMAGVPGVAEQAFEVCQVEGNWQPNSVTAIVQTHDGYIWLGTYHGLVRFDGVSFTVFDSGNTPSLPNGRITSLYESPDHVLWIGHETGHVTRLANGRFQTVALPSNWIGGAIEAFSIDEVGNVWLLNDTGALLGLRDGKIAQIPGGNSALTVGSLSQAKDGRLWTTAYGKIATLDHGNIMPVTFPGDLPDDIYERVLAARDGGMWVLGHGRLREWRAGAWSAEVTGFPRETGAVSAMMETQSGLLLGTLRNGLYMLKPGAEPLHFSRANGLSHDWIRALCMDQEGNCWIGTGIGFDGLRPRKVRMVSPPDGWQGFGVLSFSVHSDDTGWIGTEGGGLYRYDGHQWSIFGKDAGLMNPFVWSVLETRQHELFVGTWGAGLFRWNSHHFESSGDLGRIAAPVTAMYEDQGGELWIGTHEGLYCHDSGRQVRFIGKDKLAFPDVRTIAESPIGTLWFGMSGGGLAVLKEGVLTQFRQKDGLGSDLVSCLYADQDGSLWIGTTDNGLTRLKQGKFARISTAQGLPGKVIYHIVDDGLGQLWIGSLNGILRVSKAELNRCADGQASSIHCLTYGQAEGLPAACTGGFQPGACRSADGRLWFPTNKGLAVIDPANITFNSVPPPVVIEALFVDGSTTNNWLESQGLLASGPAKPQLQIPPGHRRFEFHYTGLSFVAPDKVRFRRKLKGLERDWVDAENKRVVEYSYLPPGNYTLKVIACNNDDVWNKTGASVSFTVLPYFWQTLWFRIAAIATSAAVMAAGVVWGTRRRMNHKLKQVERARALERERARIARDIHDDLGASLTHIGMLSQSLRSEIRGQPEALAEADQIHNSARELTRAMDEIVWAVNPRYDTLDSLAAYLGRFAQQYLSSAAIRCRLNLPVHLPPITLTAEVRHNVFLAFKEALHNVVKHAKASEVSVALELHPTRFELLVVDNGRGFQRQGDQSSALTSHEELRSATGNGLLNMSQRMEEIGGRCDWNSVPGEGTRTKFTVFLNL